MSGACLCAEHANNILVKLQPSPEGENDNGSD
jgi:hypothetical protein